MPTLCQANGQLNGQQQQPNSPNQKIQSPGPVSKVGDGWLGGVPVVAIHDDTTDVPEAFSLKPVTHSPPSNGYQTALVNGTQQLPTPDMPAVNVDGPGLTAPTSISAAPSPTFSSPPTPTPSMSFEFHQLESSSTPKEDDLGGAVPDSSITTPPSSSVTPTTSRPTSTSVDPALFSCRPAPPSPALSRRVSGVPSTSSSRSRSSRPPSLVVSRAKRQSQLSQLMTMDGISTTSSTADRTPFGLTDAAVLSATPAPAPVYIKIRDYAFAPADERHLGLGTDTPKANRVNRLNRKLGGPDRARARAAAGVTPRRTDSIGSVDSSDADVEEEEEEDEGWGIGISGWGKGSKGWDGFKMGMGRFSWTMGASHSNIPTSDKDSTSNGVFPTRKDLDMNFMDSSSSSSSDDDEQPEQAITEEFPEDDDDLHGTGLQRPADDEDADADAENGEEQEPLYPGLYRALYAFEPEGTAEMKLDEDQIVRVVGRGGGVGWAVVVDERGSSGPLKHALVPEGYLEVVRLDWEDEDEMEFSEHGDEDGYTDAVTAEDA